MGYELICSPPDSYVFNNQSAVLGQILVATANYSQVANQILMASDNGSASILACSIWD